MNRATLALFFLFTARKKVLTGLSENGIFSCFTVRKLIKAKCIDRINAFRLFACYFSFVLFLELTTR